MIFFYGLELEKVNYIPVKTTGVLNVWLGNSDTETNNHLDAIDTLKHFRNNDIKIICPLSYGVNPKYGDLISTKGNLIFDKKWVSIREFMPYDKYVALFKDINVVIMNHNRTQASGNIFVFVKMGKKIFLKRQSTLFQLLINADILVFDANIIKDLSFEEFSKPLTDEQIQSNIEKISALFSEEKRIEYLNQILN